MNIENQKHKIKRANRSQLTRKIVIQYFLSILVFIISFILLFFFAWYIASRFTWYSDNPIYHVLKWIKEWIILLSIPIFLTGWIILTYYFMNKPLRYLDDIVEASEKLVTSPNEPITLPNDIVNMQNELNMFRERALANEAMAKDAERRKNDMVVYLAHDLKTPLTSVIGYLTLLCDEQQISDEMREKYLSICLKKSERLEDLINEFFDITRFNLADVKLTYSTVNLIRFLEQLVFEFQPMLMEKKLECRLNSSPDIMISCDTDKMQRVFDNLLRNAVFYSYDNSAIEIDVMQNENGTNIKILNYGDTISSDKLEHIFEPFYRLDKSRGTNSGGAGLGLAFAKQVVELHNGIIYAMSENQTITLNVLIPLS